MLFNDLKTLSIGILLYAGAMIACAGYAYYVNARRAEDDPKKRHYHPLGIIFAPVTLPMLIFVSISLFLLKALAYGVILILFAMALIFIRKPFLPAVLQRSAMRIGEALLEATTFLARLFQTPWMDQPKSIKIAAEQASL